MSADPKKIEFEPNPSQGDFWGGYMMDAWLYKFLAVFPLTGFLGIDKLALRSPFTALLKFLINLFFWGAWYFYDMIQLFTDSESLGKYGFSNPYGVSGHGYKFLHGVTDVKTDDFAKPSNYNGGFVSTLLFLLYTCMTLFFGFTGLPAMLVGDFYGGLIKMFSNILILPFFFYCFAQVLEFFKGGDLEKVGVKHPWPLYPMLTVFEKYPAFYLLNKEEYKKQSALQEAAELKASEANLQPQLIQIFNYIKEGGKDLLIKVWPAARALDAADKVVNTATELQQTVKATGELAKDAVDTVKPVLAAVKKEATARSTEIADKVLGLEPMKKQTGGGLDFSSFPAELDTILLMAMGLLIFGGFAAAVTRKFAGPRRQDDDEYPRNTYERDDAPPNPGRV